jgi:Txe/YoeB family toxin of toxin-antitoxin system
VSWTVLFTKQAQKDARKLASASPALKQKAQALLDLLAADPYQQPPPYEALVGDLRGACSRRINIQHRLVVQVLEDTGVVKVLRMWSHYD